MFTSQPPHSYKYVYALLLCKMEDANVILEHIGYTQATHPQEHIEPSVDSVTMKALVPPAVRLWIWSTIWEMASTVTLQFQWTHMLHTPNAISHETGVHSFTVTLCRKLSQPSGVGILCRWLPMLSNLPLLYCSIATGQCLEKLEALHISALPSCMLLYSFLFPTHRRTWSLSCVSQHILQHYS